MQDLTWLKFVFINYKTGLDIDYKQDEIPDTEKYKKLKHKKEAADELLEQVKNFIKEANSVIENSPDGKK